jgi:hypothetical protein
MIMAKKRLCRLLGWEDNCRGYCWAVGPPLPRCIGKRYGRWGRLS